MLSIIICSYFLIGYLIATHCIGRGIQGSSGTVATTFGYMFFWPFMLKNMKAFDLRSTDLEDVIKSYIRRATWAARITHLPVFLWTAAISMSLIYFITGGL